MSENAAVSELVIETRTPSITSENASLLPAEKMDSQWNLLTEVIRRDIQIKPDVRKELEKFCTEPISETIPKEFFDSLSKVDPRMEDLTKRYQSEIGIYLNLPPVPDEEVKPDIRNASSLGTPEGRKRYLAYIYEKEENDPQIQEELEKDVKAGVFLHGITREERSMIAKRYRFARDVKILALGAEILEQGNLAPNEKGEIVLPSGIKIVLDANEDNGRSDLLSPCLWERRRQLKDRVHEIEVNGKKYILKEKKTALHTDTKKLGHQDGRLSSEEFATAKYFQEYGSAEEGRIKLTWEKPVGFVSYPDGFQFAVFEYEKGLIPISEITSKLREKILKNRDQFEGEFNLVSNLAKKYKNDKRVLRFAGYALLQKIMPAKKLTFDEFVRIKAFRMKKQSRSLMTDLIAKNGYRNSDIDGYAFKIDTNGEMKLQIVGFDFEYFSKMSEEDKIMHLELRKQFEDEKTAGGLNFLNWEDERKISLAERAAYLALLEAEHIKA